MRARGCYTCRAPGAGEAVNRALGCGVRALSLRAFLAGLRGHVYDDALALLEHLPRARLCTKEYALDVDGEHLVERFVIQLVLRLFACDVYQQTRQVDACVVDQRVDFAELCNDGIRHCLYAVAVCNVTLNTVRAVQLRTGLYIHVYDDRLSACLGQCVNHVLADAGCTAGDDHHIAFQT